MKKTILLLAILTICASVLAQKNRMEQEFGKRSKVKIENTIYTYDRTLQIVEDSTNNEARWAMKCREHSNLELAKDRLDFFRSVFTTERIKELKGNRVHIMLLLDDKGNILEFRFFLRNAPDVTLKDLHALAKALKKTKLFKTRRDTGAEEGGEIWVLPLVFDEL